MKYFENFNHSLFYRKPEVFTKDSPKEILSSALGATLYIPSIRNDLLHDVIRTYHKDCMSVVICLEDSIPDDRVEEGEQKLHELLKNLHHEDSSFLPLVFVRPRSPEHLMKICEDNKGLLDVITGFVFPKFDMTSYRAESFMKIFSDVCKDQNVSLYCMPVIESSSVIHQETRMYTLNMLNDLFKFYENSILAVRIGATDMSSVYGLRRSKDFTIYDVHLISSVISDIVNILGRAEDHRVITGAVWEHFSSDRTFKPSLRESIFKKDKEFRKKILTENYDNFIREISLDKINGIMGKTIIHPSHIGFVNSLMVVTHEEYHDAQDILYNDNGGGAYSSLYKNKMNEVKPHYAWAKKVDNRARIFGVSNPHVDFVDFLEGFYLS